MKSPEEFAQDVASETVGLSSTDAVAYYDALLDLLNEDWEVLYNEKQEEQNGWQDLEEDFRHHGEARAEPFDE